MVTREKAIERPIDVKQTAEFVFSPTGEPAQVWVLSKGSGETYRVDLKDFVCSCADFKFRHAKGDRMCKHLKAASEAYGIELQKAERLPAIVEGQAITICQEEVMQQISQELRDEMVKNYVYAVPDYEREYTDKVGKKRTTKKSGWIDLKATGVRDLAHMVADRYGAIEVGDFRFMDVGDRWIAWRDIRLGNFTATGFADCAKDREFPFRYLGEVAMRNAYKAIVPKIYQDIFTNKFREMMRTQLRELLGTEGEVRLTKPVDQLTDGELAKELKEAQENKLRLKSAPNSQAQSPSEVKDRETAEVGDSFVISSEWLTEAQKRLKWTNETMLSFIISQYKVTGKTVTEALNKLTKEQAEDFTRKINQKLEKQSSML